MFSTYLYYGPIIIVDKLGSNPFVSQIVVGMSEFLACPFSYWFVEKLPRVRTGQVSFAFALVFNLILIFIHTGEDCHGCFAGIVQIFLVFASRFVISFYSSLFFLYATEIFPLRARGLGFGMCSAMGALASSSGQFIFSYLEDEHISPMILFSSFSLLAIIVFCFMNETLNQPLQDEIEEIKALKMEEREQRNGASDEAEDINFSDRDGDERGKATSLLK